jgi:hypothetical protein
MSRDTASAPNTIMKLKRRSFVFNLSPHRDTEKTTACTYDFWKHNHGREICHSTIRFAGNAMTFTPSSAFKFSIHSTLHIRRSSFIAWSPCCFVNGMIQCVDQIILFGRVLRDRLFSVPTISLIFFQNLQRTQLLVHAMSSFEVHCTPCHPLSQGAFKTALEDAMLPTTVVGILRSALVNDLSYDVRRMFLSSHADLQSAFSKLQVSLKQEFSMINKFEAHAGDLRPILQRYTIQNSVRNLLRSVIREPILIPIICRRNQ